MKTFYLLPLLLLLLSCVTPQTQQEKTLKAETTSEAPRRVIKEFSMITYNGIPWGVSKKATANVDQFKGTGIDAVDLGEIVVAKGPIKDKLVTSLLVTWGFRNDRLVFGTQIYTPKDLTKLEEICNRVLDRVLFELGAPTAQNGMFLLWQNTHTTVVMSCSEYGPMLDWYNTLWLRSNQSFVASSIIPKELINGNFGTQIPGVIRDPKKRKEESK